jgi:hypothetical protein
MRFHALLVVRDEGDIIRQSLSAALKWADAIYVYDTGSTDGTWETIEEFARDDSRVVLYRHEPVWFRNEIRAILFDRYRSRAEAGDWFVTLDADEFFHIPPPEFVNTRLAPHETAVSYQLYDFKLTKVEYAQLQSADQIQAERALPIELRRRYFVSLRYSESRLFKYRPTMQWVPPNAPYNMGFISRSRIPIRHYSDRDPMQMENKYRMRLQMRPYVGCNSSPHWQVTDWRELLKSADDPELTYWRPCDDLPAYEWTNHLAPPHMRFAQRLVHRTLLPILDRMRPGFPPGYQASPIPPEVDRELRPVAHQSYGSEDRG